MRHHMRFLLKCVRAYVHAHKLQVCTAHGCAVILNVCTCGWVVDKNSIFRETGTIVCLNREAYSRTFLPTLGALLKGMKWSFEISDIDP